jgi:hypothetical protein
MQITTTVEITPQQLADIFTTAIESGDPVTCAKRGGWCEGIYLESPGDVPFDPPYSKGLPWYAMPHFYLDPDLRIKVVEVSDETSGATTDHYIGQQEIHDGLAKMAKTMPRDFQSLVGDHDSADADTFLQMVVFGETVYG